MDLSRGAVLRRNILGIKILRGLNCGSTLPIPIFVGFYLAHGLSLGEVFVLHAIFSTAVALLEVPSGYIADRLGRTLTLRVAAMSNAAGIGIYALSNGWGNFSVFVCAELALATAVSLISGSDEALVADSLRELGEEYAFGHHWSQAATIGSISDGLMFAAGAFAAAYGPGLHLAAAFGMYVAALAVALTLHEPIRQIRPITSLSMHLQMFVQVLRAGFTHPEIRTVVLFAAANVAVCRSAVWAIEPYLRPLLGTDNRYALVVGALAVTVAFSALAAPPMLRRLGFVPVSNALTFVIGVSYLALGIFVSPWAAVFMAIVQASAQVQLVAASIEINRHAESEFRATVLSIRPCVERVLMAVILTAMGWLLTGANLPLALLIAGFVVLCGAMVTAEMRRR